MAIAAGGIMIFVWIMNSYPIPKGAMKRMTKAQGIEYTDGMVWNITDEGVRTRVAMMNSQPFPPRSGALMAP